MRRRGGAPPRWVFAVVAFAVVAGWLVSGFYSVPQGNRGVLLRFGREVRVVSPGPHWRWPDPIASDRIVSVRQIHIVAIGYQRSSKLYEGEPAPTQASMLTLDQDIVNLEFAVQYRVENPSHYLFTVDHPRKTVARAAEAVMRQVIAGTTSHAVLTASQQPLEVAAKVALQRLLDRYHAGIHVVAIKIQKAVPPKPVMAALQKVVQAREDARRQQSQAMGYANSILPKAQADAATLIDKARSYRATVVAHAKGRAARFRAIAKVYRVAPKLTRERLFIGAMARVYRKAPKIVLSDSAHTVINIPLADMWHYSARKAPPAPIGKKP
ncbi:MAG: FtsH protease activity modulator HflK [Acidiferrobacter sp.]